MIGAIASLIGDPVTDSIVSFIKSLAENAKLTQLGHTVLNVILDQVPDDYSGRVEQMEEAYGIIYFTAFFDELDTRLPKNIRRNIQLSLNEKQLLLHSSVPLECAEYSNRREIICPNIVRGYAEVDAELREMYRSMGSRLRDFVRGLSFQDTAEEKDIRAFDEVIKELPAAAIKRFHDQYMMLCANFNEFYIFTQIEHEKAQELKLDSRYQNILSIAMQFQDSAEAGLKNLKKVILDLPNQIKKNSVQEIVKQLIKTYQGSIDRPLIESKSSEEKLTYPLISNAFIPQAYKLLRYSGNERLEQLETWEHFAPMQNMMSFWAKYYLDPGSVENLLLILGEPGGGKSLLTKILCARMIDFNNICIRIPLREHDMEDDIETIVCEQITQDGDASEPISTFKWFAEEFQNNPITLLFDGYDEVMQATGGVYRNLLTKLQQFQDRCREQSRPIRIVVTSRETLIDKADIPQKTTVMKLLEFDETQRKQWINIWNEHNHVALAKVGLRDFALPEGNKDIEELSGQPLLLLMLAIYDANFETKKNALKQADGQMESLDRTKLYDELLRRFIRRELRKGPRGQEHAYEEATPEEQDAMVDEEMKKLGISALGMFVREKLSLKVGELEDDLIYMRAKVTGYDSRNIKMLKSAETVFGSFFFIHDSRTENEADEKEAAFEFLHKTFYEFLVADLILQYLIDATDDLSERKCGPKRGKTHYLEALENPDSLNDAYYATINSSCLCREPEIIRMIAEWKDSKLNKFFQGKSPNFGDEMAQVLSDLFNKHTDMIRSEVFTPFVQRKGGLAGGKDYLQACAVYLMNLIILQILIAGECHVKVEEWNYISQFLKLNLPLSKKDSARELKDENSAQKLKIDPYEEIILKFMALFLLQRENDEIVLTKKTQVGKLERENLREARMDVFKFMQDDTTQKVYRLHDSNSSMNEKQRYRGELRNQGFDFGFELYVVNLHEDVINLEHKNIHNLEESFKYGVRYLHRNCVDVSLVLDWFLLIRLIIDKLAQQNLQEYKIHNVWNNGFMRETWEEITDIIFRHYIDYKEIILIFIEITKKLGYGKFLLKKHSIDMVLNHYHYTSPDLVTVFLEAILEMHLPLHEMNFYCLEHCKMLLENMDSPKAIATFLKFIYTAGIVLPDDLILRNIQKEWNYYLRKSPEELPALLRVYLQMGQFQEVKTFFRRIEDNEIGLIIRSFNHYTDSMIEFLSVAQAVGENQNLSKRIILFFEEDIPTLQNPNVFMQLVHQAVCHNFSRISTNSLTNIFIKNYDVMFHYDPEQAVNLLFQIGIKQIDSIDIRMLSKECIYSLQSYRFILETSVKAAARLLILCEKNNLEPEFINEVSLIVERRSLSFYITLCFDKALFTRDRTNIYLLEELLDNMTSGIVADMEKYFKKQLPFLKAYSWKLAEKVKTIYGMA